MSATRQFYIAYSIHGSNAFIIATKTMLESSVQDNEVILPDGKICKVVPSRDFTKKNHESEERRNSIKLHHPNLLTKKGEPLRSPPHILRVFKALEKDGWTIDRSAFIARHRNKYWAKGTNVGMPHKRNAS